MDRKQRVYEKLLCEIEEREEKFKALKGKPKTRLEIDRLVHKYKELQLSVLEEYGLTNQERAVAFYVLFGISYINISKLMVVQQSTVSFHVRNIFKKCHVSSRQDLCMLVLTKMYFAGIDESQPR